MRPLLTNLYRILLIATGLIAAGQILAQVEPSVTFEGRAIRFAKGERPFYSGRTAMVPLRTVCLAIGAGVKRSRDGRQWTLTRGTDRLECTPGNSWFVFNGVREPLRAAPEGHDPVLFVPFELVQTIAGGALAVKADYADGKEAKLFLGDRLLRFRQEEAPFRQDGTIYVPLQATASYLGAHVDARADRLRLSVVRSRDKISYDQGARWFTFNGVQKPLLGESVIRGKVIFVPVELLQALVGDELRGR